jgi:phosphoribosyl 1,2-cyclic phosphate phosphodiesterase
LKLTFLGTGTSFGVPVIGCDCPTCSSDDPRDRRTRHAALLTLKAGRLLVDTPPELRIQLLTAGVDRVDAVWFTHTHADHVHGIDDLRIFSLKSRATLPILVGPGVAAEMSARFPYIFDPAISVPSGTSKPELRFVSFDPDAPVRILGREIVPLELPHGPMTVWGFRVGSLGYVTDAKELRPRVLDALRGVDVLVLNALWWGNPHPTHFNVEEAVEAAGLVGARRTYLTHLTHRLRHAELLEALPPGIEPAYDGLTVDLGVSSETAS